VVSIMHIEDVVAIRTKYIPADSREDEAFSSNG
jgi:hypothetical protein